jgi:hypothetical protein
MQNVDLELRLSQKRCVVMCPTAKLPAEVKLDTNLGLESCSRWSEYGDCAQTCAPQIEFSSESLEDFVAIYGGRRCACCGAVLTAQDWYNNRLAALRSAIEEPNPSRVLLTTSITLENQKLPACSVCFSAIH